MHGDACPPFSRPRESRFPWMVGVACVAAVGIAASISHYRIEVAPRTIAPPAARPAPVREAPAPAAVPARAAVARPRLEAITPERVTLWLCKSYEGVTFWTRGTCQSQRATVERMVTVPGHLDFEQQVAIGNRQWREAAALYVTPPAGPAAAIQRSEPATAVCADLARQIEALDAQARQPLPGDRHDAIRRERMEVRASQARHRC